jgi:hypothetical protein
MRKRKTDAMPEGFDADAAERWRIIAPILWKNRLLTDETRADVEWLCRLHSRSMREMRLRAEGRARPDPDDQDGLESLRVTRMLSRLEYRYGLNALGRKVMADRGYPGTLNPPDDDMREADEMEISLP